MNSTQHPLVTHYLDDLAGMLDHLPPGDRAEVLAGVREHIDAGLAARGGASDADVGAVLSEVGSPEDVAREAYSPGQYAERPTALPARPRWSDRPWVPVAVALLQVIALLGLVVTMLGAGVYVTTEVTGSDGQSVRTVDYQVGAGLMLLVAGLVVILPLWIALALLVGNSRLWTTRHKLVHLLLLPVSALVLGLIPDLGWVLAGERGLTIASVTGLVLVLVVDAWLLLKLTRAGWAAVSH